MDNYWKPGKQFKYTDPKTGKIKTITCSGKSEKGYRTTITFIKVMAILGVWEGFSILFGGVFFGLEEGDFTILVMGLMWLALMSVLIWYSFIKMPKNLEILKDVMQKQAEEDKKSELEFKKQQFLQECLELNFSDPNSKSARAKIALIAQKYGFSEESQEALELYQKLKESKIRQEIEARIQNLIEEEKLIEQNNKKYMSFFGRDKKIQYCEDKIDEYRGIIAAWEQKEQQISQSGENYYKYSKERESSWAIHGGMVNGLAGPAAGVSRALEIQAENENKRARNQTLLHNVASTVATALEHIWKEKDEAKENRDIWEEKLEKAKLLLVEKISSSLLLEKLSPSVEKIQISETKAIRLDIKINRVTDLMIMDNVKATIDGHFMAEIWCKEKRLGVAHAALPFYGANGSVILCVCRKVTDKSLIPNDPQELKVIFKPCQLWAIEIDNY